MIKLYYGAKSCREEGFMGTDSELRKWRNTQIVMRSKLMVRWGSNEKQHKHNLGGGRIYTWHLWETKKRPTQL